MKNTVIIKNYTREAFEIAFKLLALDNAPFGKEFKCCGYKIINNELFLFRYSDKCEKFPYEFNLKQTIEFAWGWWENNQKPNEVEPDTDGSTKVAYEISTERSGVGSFDWGTFVSLKPIWFVYGK